MKEISITSDKIRLNDLLNKAWDICIQKISNQKIIINKEASLQLHYSSIINTLGEIYCTEKDDRFTIELESKYDKKNIDICCSLGSVKAAIELKCFRKASKRAVDTDMYDVLKDITRLQTLEGFQTTKIICLTDDSYYAEKKHNGHAKSVSIKDALKYEKGKPIKPSWSGKWSDKNRDTEIIFNKDITFNWYKCKEWYFLNQDV